VIIVPYRITEKFIRDHPELTFVYSSDLEGKGGLGMQWFMAGPSNSYPVPTLVKFCANSVYFQDAQEYGNYHPFGYHAIPESGLKYNQSKIDEAISFIPKNNPIIVPPKIGLGCARMKEYCPRTYAYLRSELNKIMCKDVKIDYSYISG